MRRAQHFFVGCLIYAVFWDATSLPDADDSEEYHVGVPNRHNDYHHQHRPYQYHNPVQAQNDPPAGPPMPLLFGFYLMCGILIGVMSSTERVDFSILLAPLRTLFRGLSSLSSMLSVIPTAFSLDGRVGEFATYVVLWGLFHGFMQWAYAGDNERRHPQPHDQYQPALYRQPAGNYHHAPQQQFRQGTTPPLAGQNEWDSSTVVVAMIILVVALLALAQPVGVAMIRSSFSEIMMIVNLALVTLWVMGKWQSVPVRGLFLVLSILSSGSPAGSVFALAGTVYGMFNAARMFNRVWNGDNPLGDDNAVPRHDWPRY